MYELKTLNDLTEDEKEASSSAVALVAVVLQELQANPEVPKEKMVDATFHARDLISAYFEVYMGLDSQIAEASATSLLVDLIDPEVEK